MKNIPFLDVKSTYLELKDDIDKAIHRVLNSGNYILGEEVASFEVDFSKYCCSKHAITVANGLDALTLSLRSLGIGAGDKVIVPSNTYVATWLAVSAVGAIPVPVDPDLETYNIDPEKLDQNICPDVKAVIIVHLYGQPADLGPLIRLAKKKSLWVIEDAAQAHGAEYKSTKIGAHGDLVCWSFYPGKNLGAFGDGGCITCNSNELAKKLRMLRNYGSHEKYVHELKGVNSRLDPIQAAVLGVKLKKLDCWNNRRRVIAGIYMDALANTDISLPFVPDYANPVWHLYVIKVPKRDDFQKKLLAFGVNTSVHYPIPPIAQKAYATSKFQNVSKALITKLSSEILSIPIGPHVSMSDAKQVAEAISKVRRTI